MSGTVFMETLRRGWRTMIYWSIGFALYGFIMAVFIQDANMLKQYGEIFKSFPPALLQLFGGESAAFLATPEGFMAYGFFGFAVLILSVYAITAGLNVTANEEDQGILDIVLSLPLARWRVIAEKVVAYALMLTVVIAVSYVAVLVGNQMSALKIDAAKIINGTVNILPATLLILAFTVFAAVLFRSKGTAVAVTALFVIVSYFVNFLGEAFSGTILEQLRVLSFFKYYDHNAVIQFGLNWGNMGLLLVVAVLLFGGSLWLFQRRDVGL